MADILDKMIMNGVKALETPVKGDLNMRGGAPFANVK